jgi:hypothetical protein
MTLTHPPATLTSGDTIAADSTIVIHRPRRWRWWPAALAVSGAVALAALGLGQAASPALSFDGEPTVWRTAPGDLVGVSRVDNALGTEMNMGFERLGTFSAEIPLVNHGRYPVRVTGLPERGAYYYGLDTVEMASDATGPFSTFHPFTLRRGATRWLVLHFRFADCDLEHGDGTQTFARSNLPVDYRVFGLHRRETVPFTRFALSVPSGRCDRPVM